VHGSGSRDLGLCDPFLGTDQSHQRNRRYLQTRDAIRSFSIRPFISSFVTRNKRNVSGEIELDKPREICSGIKTLKISKSVLTNGVRFTSIQTNSVEAMGVYGIPSHSVVVVEN